MLYDELTLGILGEGQERKRPEGSCPNAVTQRLDAHLELPFDKCEHERTQVKCRRWALVELA
jgi:hypothetical protein